MAFVGLLAIDFATLVALPPARDEAIRIGILGAIPMADVLAICLVIVVSNLVRRGEVSLSRVMFLFFGGTAVLLLVGIANLAPKLLFAYLNNTAGYGMRSSPNDIRAFIFGIGSLTLALTSPLLFPALFAGWMTRGYRLKLLKGPPAEGDAERALTD
jgi:Kef-type K+ transport system membrane component KefB